MTDLVITTTQKTDEKELIQTLRSIEKNLQGYGEIMIVGHLPDSIQGVLHIPFSDHSINKFSSYNRFKKLSAACIDTRLSEEILLVDAGYRFTDFFGDAGKYPYFSSGYCCDSVGKRAIPLKRTSKMLKGRGFTDFDFENNFPFRIERNKFINSFRDIDFMTPHGYAIKSIYYALNNPEGALLSNMYPMKSNFDDKCSYEK